MVFPELAFRVKTNHHSAPISVQASSYHSQAMHSCTILMLYRCTVDGVRHNKWKYTCTWWNNTYQTQLTGYTVTRLSWWPRRVGRLQRNYRQVCSILRLKKIVHDRSGRITFVYGLESAWYFYITNSCSVFLCMKAHGMICVTYNLTYIIYYYHSRRIAHKVYITGGED